MICEKTGTLIPVQVTALVQDPGNSTSEVLMYRCSKCGKKYTKTLAKLYEHLCPRCSI